MEEKSGGAWLVMKRSDTVFNGGKLAGSAVEQVIAVTVGQPAPSLFQIPSGYTERSPSEALARRALVLDRTCVYCKRTGEVLDQVYESAHSF